MTNETAGLQAEEAQEISALLGELTRNTADGDDDGDAEEHPFADVSAGQFFAALNWANSRGYRAPWEPAESEAAPKPAAANPAPAAEEIDPADAPVPIPRGNLNVGSFFRIVNWRNAADAPGWPTRGGARPKTVEWVGDVESIMASIAWD